MDHVQNIGLSWLCFQVWLLGYIMRYLRASEHRCSMNPRKHSRGSLPLSPSKHRCQLSPSAWLSVPDRISIDPYSLAALLSLCLYQNSLRTLCDNLNRFMRRIDLPTDFRSPWLHDVSGTWALTIYHQLYDPLHENFTVALHN